MEKKLINKEIFVLVKKSSITWNDIKHIEFQDNDIINMDEDDDEHYVCVMRQVLETDEEFAERMEWSERTREMLRKNRYNQYLKLKEEFDK